MEADYTQEQKDLIATGKFCDTCAKSVGLVEEPGRQLMVWYGECSNCSTVALLPGPDLYWNGSV